jgi:ABC-type uncharacterized transport system permease subunit
VEQVSVILFWFAFALYIGATVLYSYQFFLRRQKVGWWARFATGAGFLLQTASIGINSVANDGTPLSGSNQLVLASWALVLLYFIMEHVMKVRAYGAFLVPVAVLAMAVAQLLGGGGSGSLVPPDAAIENQLNSWGVGFHVALIVFANAGFAVGAVSSMLYLYQEFQLKAHRSNRISRRLPSLAILQTVARRAIALAFPVYSAGLGLGIVRAIQVDVGGWWMDPRIMMSGAVLATFGVYLVLVYRHDVSGRTNARVATLGFVFVVILAIIARTLPVGFHVFGQL